MSSGSTVSGMRTPHTHFKRGTPLRVILRSGQHVYDHYEDHGSGYMILRKHGKLQLRFVKAVTIWKRGVTEVLDLSPS